jgi:hypothetical protein
MMVISGPPDLSCTVSPGRNDMVFSQLREAF